MSRQADMNSSLVMTRLLIAAVVLIYDSPTVLAQPIPTGGVEEVLVKTSLLTLNDANLTGNYDVLHAKMAKAFRDKFDAEILKQAFKSFSGHHIDVIAAKPIVPISEAKINGDGELMLRGYFDATPSRLSYELEFAVSEGEWKLITINVEVTAPSTRDVAASVLNHATNDFSAAGSVHQD